MSTVGTSIVFSSGTDIYFWPIDIVGRHFSGVNVHLRKLSFAGLLNPAAGHRNAQKESCSGLIVAVSSVADEAC